MENWLKMTGEQKPEVKDVCSSCQKKFDNELPFVYDNYFCAVCREKKHNEQSYAMYVLSYGYNHGRTMR